MNLNESKAEQLLDAIKTARKSKTSWIDVANILSSIEDLSQFNHEGRPWIKVASEISGFTANHLRRMQKASDFLSSFFDTSDKSFDKRSIPFGHAETAARIYNMDQKAGETCGRANKVWPCTQQSLLHSAKTGP